MPQRRKLLCCFKDCTNPSLAQSSKCLLHRYRERCQVANCPNQVYARQRCVRHGGKRQCQRPDCRRNVRTGIYCSKHNPNGDKQCSEEGCIRQAHARRKCVRHGGGRLCSMTHCIAYARREGMCIRHHRLSILSQDVTQSPMDVEEFAFIDELVNNSSILDRVVEYSVATALQV
ncbi:hypothetical protein THRCLA_02838 [Thraustotheca clavata]|uniref:WRKY transcription factor 19 n=1 Tax=Thraustotheca clavata TaxID=74557 RepID=A0A1W0A468_9STRA|nr:hypothetical protein THRCLA_02838 [Thraustotheca clavata]